MGRRWVGTLIAVMAVVAVSGVGYSVFTSTANLTANGSAGNLFIQWACIRGAFPCDSSRVGVPTPGVGSAPYVGCSFVYTNGPAPAVNTLTIIATNLAPGDACTMPLSFGGVLVNFGSLPAQLTISELSSSITCGSFQWTDNLFFTGGIRLATTTPAAPPIPIGSGQFVPAGGYTGILELLPAVQTPNSCQGQTDSVTWGITGSAGT